MFEALGMGAVRLQGSDEHDSPDPAADAAIVRIKETGTSIAMSLDGNGRYCYLDPREGTKLVVAECCRNLSTVGALPVADDEQPQFREPGAPRDYGATG